MAADLSARHGWIGQDSVQRIRQLLERAGLPVEPPTAMNSEQFLGLMAVDKKALDSGLRLILLDAIGNARVCGDYDKTLLNETLEQRPAAAAS